tara:strand:- start:41399 stop:42730 length:1332 start_codon:yes stop_codon:yes gene_type:complete
MNRQILSKISLSFISLVLSLVLLEGGLRLAGAYIVQESGQSYTPYEESSDYSRDEVYEKFGTKKVSGTILAIGDSFTNAGNVKSFHSYPYYLYELFSKTKQPKSVLNMGLCEDSTFGVKDRLKEFIKDNKTNLPESVVMLVGSADKFERFEIESDDKLKLDWYEVNPPSFYKSLRIYKVFRHIKLSLMHKYLLGSEEIEEGDFDQVKNVYLELKEKSLKKEYKFNEDVYLAKLPNGFKKYCEGLNISFSTAKEMIHSTLIYMTKILSSNLRHDDAFYWLVDLAKTFPEEFWSGKFEDAYYRIIQVYQIQSKYDAEFVLTQFNEKTSSHKYFKEFFQMIKEQEAVDTYVDRKRMEAWKEIIEVTKKNKIKLYVMNYPSDYKSANEIIGQVVSSNNVHFINNNQYFKDIIKKEGRAKILEDDDHLTPFGYKLLAEHIFLKMKESP